MTDIEIDEARRRREDAEHEVLSRAIITALHTLTGFMQDESLLFDQRVGAVDRVLSYSSVLVGGYEVDLLPEDEVEGSSNDE